VGQDVTGAFGQWRQGQLDGIEAVEQIFAELAVADHRRQVGIGRTDHADFDLALAVGAQPLETSGLEHAQQFHLPAGGKVADLVQEQGAAVGGFKFAFACLVGAGVGAGLGTEQLGLDQLGRNRAAVERDERAPGDQRIGLDDLGDLLLARAVGAGDQHRQCRARHLAGQADHALAGRVGHHRTAQIVPGLQRRAIALFAVAAAVEFAAGFGQFQQVVDRDQ